jgi:hypothetical protein
MGNAPKKANSKASSWQSHVTKKWKFYPDNHCYILIHKRTSDLGFSIEESRLKIDISFNVSFACKSNFPKRAMSFILSKVTPAFYQEC